VDIGSYLLRAGNPSPAASYIGVGRRALPFLRYCGSARSGLLLFAPPRVSLGAFAAAKGEGAGGISAKIFPTFDVISAARRHVLGASSRCAPFSYYFSRIQKKELASEGQSMHNYNQYKRLRHVLGV
jgi:hypothetical protein